MDKINVILMVIIGVLLAVNIYICFSLWQEGGGSPQPDLQEQELAQEERNLAVIAMDDQSQAINGGSEDMVFRARIEGEDADISSFWKLASDGFYYCSEPVAPGGRSRPLLKTASAEISVHLEAIQTNWLTEGASINFNRACVEPVAYYKSSFN